MSKQDWFYYTTLFVAGIPGIIFRTYTGGIITGAAWGILIVVIIGKKSAMESARRIDKRTKDILTDQDDPE